MSKQTWSIQPSYSHVVSDQPLEGGLGNDQDSVQDYGGYLVCESVAKSARGLIVNAPEMKELLESIENDKGQVPDWLWTKIQQVLYNINNFENDQSQ